jgi:uncharacterized protein YxjI
MAFEAQRLLDRSTFFVKEHVGLFKMSDAYDILDPESKAKIGLARESTPGWVQALRFLLNKRMLPTAVEIIESPDDQGRGNLVATIRRGFTLLRAKVQIMVGGREVGHLRSKLFSIGGGFTIHDATGRQIGEVKGSWTGWNFQILDQGGRELGTVSKQWSGLGKELFTSADNYMISLTGSGDIMVDLKVLLLSAALAIDTVYNEN